jgi:hypothetical protein
MIACMADALNETDFALMLEHAHSTCGCDDCFNKVTLDVEVLVAELRTTYALLGKTGLTLV